MSWYGLTVEQRFWRKVDHSPEEPNECWPWCGGSRREGRHAKFRLHAGKKMYAHRYAWTVTRGKIPKGLHVLHKCDNPVCCNPNHLWLGTHQDNMADRNAKKRQAFGERNGPAKLKETEVIEIRARAALGDDLGELARAYLIARRTVRGIVAGETWKHLLH